MMLSLAACGSSSNKAESSSYDKQCFLIRLILSRQIQLLHHLNSQMINEFVGIDVDILAAIAKDQIKYDLQSFYFDAAEAAQSDSKSEQLPAGHHRRKTEKI